MSDLFPNHAPKSIAGLNLEAAIANAEETAAKERYQLAQDRKRLRQLEAEREMLEAKDEAYAVVFQPSPERDQFRAANLELLRSVRRRIERLREKLGPLAIAAVVAFVLTFPAIFQANPPSVDRSPLQRAPHDAGQVSPVQRQDDAWTGFSAWG